MKNIYIYIYAVVFYVNWGWNKKTWFITSKINFSQKTTTKEIIAKVCLILTIDCSNITSARF